MSRGLRRGDGTGLMELKSKILLNCVETVIIDTWSSSQNIQVGCFLLNYVETVIIPKQPGSWRIQVENIMKCADTVIING
jgi:hypothetical protein